MNTAPRLFFRNSIIEGRSNTAPPAAPIAFAAPAPTGARSPVDPCPGRSPPAPAGRSPAGASGPPRPAGPCAASAARASAASARGSVNSGCRARLSAASLPSRPSAPSGGRTGSRESRQFWIAPSASSRIAFALPTSPFASASEYSADCRSPTTVHTRSSNSRTAASSAPHCFGSPWAASISAFTFLKAASPSRSTFRMPFTCAA